MNRIVNLIKNNRLIIAAFVLPSLIMAIAFATMGVYPFGNQQIAVIDFYHQYLPMMQELQYKLQHGQSLFYTWNGAGGSVFLSIIAYHAASPLNLLLILVPSKFLVEGVTALLLIRIGLSGSFMFYFLKKTYEKASFATVGFSSLYALCAYVVAYYWCFMWMDAVTLLPLCILGLRRVIDGGKANLYVITLALIIFSNYYIGIIICIFIFTYYFVLFFNRKREGGFKHFARTSVRTLLFSILAIAMTAVLLLPTWISMKTASAMSSTFPDYAFLYDDPLDIFNQLLPLSKNCYMEGLPNIGCGMAVVLCLIFYFISRNINIRGKVANALYLAFIFFSFNVNYLDYIWHGMHFPNMLPFRYAFAISFILIGMAYEAFLNIEKVEIKHVWAVFAGVLAYYLLAQKIMTDAVDDMNVFFYFGVAILLLFTALFVVYRKEIIKAKAFRYVFVALVAAELSCVVITNVNMVGSTDKYTYGENAEDIAKAVKLVDDDFCRVEIDEALTLNEPARFHFKGMSQFESAMNSVTNGLYERIGLEADPGGNRCKYTLNNPVTNAMLNIKYIIAKNEKYKDEDFSFVKKYGNTRVYENKYPLSIGYMLPPSIHTWDYYNANPFDNLNDYVRAATDNKYDNLFHEIKTEKVREIDSKIRNIGNGEYSVSPTDPTTKAEIEYKYKSSRKGKYYVFVEADAADYITVCLKSSKDDIDIDENYGAIVNIGEFDKGEVFRIDIQYELGKSGTAKCYVYYMDEKKWDKAYKLISSDMMKVTGYGNTWLKGTVDVSEPGVFVTSVPYDKGWTLKVDGKTREIMDPVGDVWISTPLDEGTHEIELKYRPPGIILGFIITIISILLLIVTHRMYDRRKESNELLASPEEDEPINDISDLI